MDIFKLLFEHDIRLDQLKERHTDRQTQDISSTLDDFLKPDLTYSKFYFTGTRLDEEKFGLNVLEQYEEIIEIMSTVFTDYYICTRENGNDSLPNAVEDCGIGSPIILSENRAKSWNLDKLAIHSNNNAGHNKEAIAELLKTDDLLLFKEKAHHGFDLHLFSKKNIYRDFFYPLKKLINDQFRFFSMNGKRVRSERKFYFETWTLERPPHGTEEVFEQTLL